MSVIRMALRLEQRGIHDRGDWHGDRRPSDKLREAIAKSRYRAALEQRSDFGLPVSRPSRSRAVNSTQTGDERLRASDEASEFVGAKLLTTRDEICDGHKKLEIPLQKRSRKQIS